MGKKSKSNNTTLLLSIRDILKYGKHRMNSINLSGIVRITEKEYKRINEIHKLINEDLHKLDEFSNGRSILVRYDDKTKSLVITAPFKNYGHQTFMFVVNKEGRLTTIGNKNYLLANEIIKHASYSIKKAIKFHKQEHSKKVNEEKVFKLANSPLKILINNEEISLYSGEHKFEIKRDVARRRTTTHISSYELAEVIKGKEYKIFDKIYIDIKKCPSWIQRDLKEEKELGKKKKKKPYVNVKK